MPAGLTVVCQHNLLHLLQQRQRRLRHDVGLGQNRYTRTHQNLVAGKLDSLERDVGVADSAFARCGVLFLDSQRRYGELEPVLHCTQSPSQTRHGQYGRIDYLDSRGRLGRRRDVEPGNVEGQIGAVGAAERHAQRLPELGARLNRNGRGRAQQRRAVELGVRSDVVELQDELRDFRLQRRTIGCAAGCCASR